MIRILLLGAVLGAAASLDLPDYIKKCKLDDPKLNDCGLASGKEALLRFLGGEPKYKIPRLQPLTIEKLRINQGGIDLTITDFVIDGIKDANIEAVQFNVKPLQITVKVTFPVITGLGKYSVDGKILVVPLKGEGDINITCTDLELVYSADLEKYKKSDGKDYIKPVNTKIKHKLKKAFFNLTNLFNGNKELGDYTNKFLNENWKDVEAEMSPAVVQTFATIATNILTGFGDIVPYENLFAK